MGSIPGSGRFPGGEHGNRSNILAWRIHWIEDPGGLKSIGSQRVRHTHAHKHSSATHGLVLAVYHSVLSLENHSILLGRQDTPGDPGHQQLGSWTGMP